MNKNLKNILLVILALAVGVGLIMLIQAIGHYIYPVPEGVKKQQRSAMLEYFDTAPLLALLFVPISYFIGCMASVLVACNWSNGRLRTIYFAGGLLLLFTVIDIINIKPPLWISVINILAMVIPILIGVYLAPRCRVESEID